MKLSKQAKLMSALTLISLPAIMLGGFVLLSVVTGGELGRQLNLNEAQNSLWRAGHAHAGVLAILGLVLQMQLDATPLKESIRWVSRISNQLAVLLISFSFFGLAYAEGFKWSMYLGILTLIVSLMILAVGLLLPEKQVVVKVNAAKSKVVSRKPLKKTTKTKKK
jgi:hypothetical protein